MNRNVIVYNNRKRFIFIEVIVIRKNVISYKIDKDFLRDEILKNNS